MRQLSPDEYKSEFERNYEYYRQRMERRLVRQVYDRERFDDICQDAFVRALTYLAHQDEEKLPQTDYHLGNLLSIMAIQVAIDDGRKDKSKDYLYLSDTQLPELMVEGHENQICNLEEFQEAIARLPQQQRDIVLAMIQGLKQKEIATNLEISKSTVSEYVRLVREELRNKSFVVAADLRGRQRVSREIDRTIERVITKAYEVCCIVRHKIDISAPLHELTSNKELTLAVEGAFVVMPDDKRVGLLPPMPGGNYEWNQKLRDYNRDFDQFFIKSLRRILIDAENQKRGLLSDTAVLGACGQYLF